MDVLKPSKLKQKYGVFQRGYPLMPPTSLTEALRFARHVLKDGSQSVEIHSHKLFRKA